ncbi:MAG TPA: YggT family protein [bacterium]|nr:YggT family protein [bacterium]
MFVFGHLLAATADILGSLLYLLEIVIIIRVIMSWANADPYNGFVKLICAIVDPLLAPFRRLVPPWRLGGLDLSPFFLLLGIEFIRKFLIPTLYDLAARLR